jgi:hypothetical protein
VRGEGQEHLGSDGLGQIVGQSVRTMRRPRLVHSPDAPPVLPRALSRSCREQGLLLHQQRRPPLRECAVPPRQVWMQLQCQQHALPPPRRLRARIIRSGVGVS